DLDRRRSGWFLVQYGAGHCRDLDQRGPWLLADLQSRGDLRRSRSAPSRPYGTGPRIVSHACHLRAVNLMPGRTDRFPGTIAIQPLSRPPSATIHVPGSKSITNRALVLAALSAECYACALRGALQTEDTEVMIDGLRQLGFRVLTEWPNSVVFVSSGENEPLVPARHADLFVGNSGTTMRFLTALVSLGHGRFRLDGVPRMRERPIADLLDGLTQLGVRAQSEKQNGCPPV